MHEKDNYPQMGLVAGTSELSADQVCEFKGRALQELSSDGCHSGFEAGEVTC